MDERLRERIRGGETADFELKTTLADARKIVEAIAAMATIGGGQIVVGVRPDGRVVGAQPGAGEVERFVQQVLANTDPRVCVDVDWPTVDGARLLRIRVPPGDGPILAFGRAFYRSGPATVSMTRDEYERRLLDPPSSPGT
jgi:predicted HTH transcriptional regulator